MVILSSLLLPSQVAEEAKSEAAAERHPAPLHSGEAWGKEEQVATDARPAYKLDYGHCDVSMRETVDPFQETLPMIDPKLVSKTIGVTFLVYTSVQQACLPCVFFSIF